MTTRRFRRKVTDPLPDRAALPDAGPRPWLVYVLSDDEGMRFSVSFAKDVGARLARHREPSAMPPTYRTPRLVRLEPYADRNTAVLRMKRLRAWSREALKALVAEGNPGLEDLAP